MVIIMSSTTNNKPNPILLHDLVRFGVILRSEFAPVEKRYFRNDDDKVIPFTTRPEYCLTKRESKEELNSLTYQVLHSIPKEEAGAVQRQANQLSDDFFMYKSYMLTIIFKKYIAVEILQEYLPMLFKGHPHHKN